MSIYEDTVREIYHLTDDGQTLAPRDRQKVEMILLEDPYDVTEEDEINLFELLKRKRDIAAMGHENGSVPK
jgi:hypothetical protein